MDCTHTHTQCTQVGDRSHPSRCILISAHTAVYLTPGLSLAASLTPSVSQASLRLRPPPLRAPSHLRPQPSRPRYADTNSFAFKDAVTGVATPDWPPSAGDPASFVSGDGVRWARAAAAVGRGGCPSREQLERRGADWPVG